MNDERCRKAMSLALAGVDWQVIADQCDYANRSDAIDAVSEALISEPPDALTGAANKQLHIARLSRMLAGVWTKATRGDARAIEVSTRLIKELSTFQGIEDSRPIDIPKEEALSAYDELAARRPGTQSGPRRQRGRRRQAGPTT